MNNELWKRALDEIDSRYTDLAAKSFRAESGRTVAVEPVLIYPPKDIKPKSRLKTIITAAASAAAAAVLIAGGAFVISRIKSVPKEPEQTAAVSRASSAASSEAPVFEGGSVPENALRFTVLNAMPNTFTEVTADPRGKGWYGVSMEGSMLTVAKFDRSGGFTCSYSTVINFSDIQNGDFYNRIFTEKGFAVLMNTYADDGLVNGTKVIFYNDDFEPVREYYNRCDGNSELYIALLSDDGNFLTTVTRDTIDVVRLGTMSGYSVPLHTELAPNVTVNRALYAVPNENGSELLVISDDEPDAVDKEYVTHITKIILDGGEVVKAENLGDEIIDANNSEPNRWGICTNNCLAYCGVYGGEIARYGFDGCQSALAGSAPGEKLYCSASPDGLYYLAAVSDVVSGKKTFRVYHCEENELKLVKEYLPREAEYSAVNNDGWILLIDKNGAVTVISPEMQYVYEGFDKHLGYNFDFDFDINAITYSETEKPDVFSTDANILSSGCTGSGDYYAASGDPRNIVCRIAAADGKTHFYAPGISASNADEHIDTRFYFTENGPAALIRVYNDNVGLISGFIALYDDNMTLRGISRIELPDSFLSGAYITYDGKYLVENHYSIYLDSLPYIRVYEIGDIKTKLIREITGLTELEYPMGSDLLTIENVIACNISKDGKKLIALADAKAGERNEAVFITKDVKTETSFSVEELQFDTQYLKYCLYNGGIAVFMPGIAEMLTGNGAEHYVFEDSKTYAENTVYAVSPNGRYIQTLTVDETGMRCEYYTYDTEKAADEGYAKWLEVKTAQRGTMRSDEAKYYGTVSGVSDSGIIFTMCRNGEGSVERNDETQDPFDEAAPMFETASDHANRLKYSALAGKLIDGEFTVTAGFEYDTLTEAGHKGIDISPADGVNAPIRAYADGTVAFVDWGSNENDLNGYGKCVIIDHGDGYETVYAHCGELYVSEGDTVKEGDIIASAGTTGLTESVCLHFELRRDGECVDPAQ